MNSQPAKQNTEQQKLSENICKNELAAKDAFPNEEFLDAISVKFKNAGDEFDVPNGIESIKIAKSRLTGAKGDERTLAKEIRQGKVLADTGASVYILPKMKMPDGRFIAGPDALVNGSLYEFKTVTGSLKRVETRFRESRDQGQNVYIRIMNPDISKSAVIQKMHNVVNSPEYTGGFKGDLIFSIVQSDSEKLYYIRIKDLKNQKNSGGLSTSRRLSRL